MTMLRPAPSTATDTPKPLAIAVDCAAHIKNFGFHCSLCPQSDLAVGAAIGSDRYAGLFRYLWLVVLEWEVIAEVELLPL
ncbi:hypothetical protein LC609_37010 [Nostoc sp. XA013]|nr:hypothetical protein [Nostoc sp. XA013]